MYTDSIHNPFEEPLVGVSLAEQSIGRTIRKRDVPFVAVPGHMALGSRLWASGLALPPCSRCSPWPGARIHGSPAQPALHDRNARRRALLHVHTNRYGMT